jgi:hypothetical protein
MLTNEDDCSVPADSMLFDPVQGSVSDPLGGLQSYRCNEFGHRCNQPLPHLPPAANQTLTGCVSAEDGKLVTVDGFVAFLKSVTLPDRLLVAALAGPPTPYTVTAQTFTTPAGVTENQPVVGHSCDNATTGFADPAVRIAEAVKAFGDRGVFEPICQNDLREPLVRIAQRIGGLIGSRCFAGDVASGSDGQPECSVALRTSSASGTTSDQALPFCGGGMTGPFPCWTFRSGGPAACAGHLVDLCFDATCDPTKIPSLADLLISCSVKGPQL